MIVIVDYGVGNIASLINMLDYLGHDACASSDPDVILRADRLILPGVGAFDRAMTNLADRQLIQPLRTAALQLGTPFLGVCLGMQLLASSSEEGTLPGLGLIDADVVRVPESAGRKVPHIGWEVVTPTGPAPLLPSDPPGRFYFVHSYVMRPRHQDDVAGEIDYGERLCVAVSKSNLHGVQFHPEKSHRYGMGVLGKFAELRR